MGAIPWGNQRKKLGKHYTQQVFTLPAYKNVDIFLM